MNDLEIVLHKVQYKLQAYQLLALIFICLSQLTIQNCKSGHCDVEHAYRAGLVVLYTIGLRKHNAYFSWFHINSNKHSNTSTHTTAENSIILYVRKRIASRPMAILRTKPGP